ncbi:hypothetical protein AB0M05_41420 [Streptomyces violaceusniger]|uniref:hypothetical protein n=1 Tax=Streptomyces violaceusniger TaxID=68280 RepID=UPI00342355A2
MRPEFPTNPLPPGCPPPPGQDARQHRPYTGPALLVLAVAAAICGVLLTVIATIKVVVAVWTSGAVPAAVLLAISLTEHCLRRRD